MEFLIIYHITLVGLAYWAKRYIIKNNDWLGLCYFLSIIFLVAILYFGNLIFFIPLSLASWIVFLIALAGIIFTWKDKIYFRKLLRHPSLYLLPIILLYFILFGFVDYQPTSWDEYENWLRRPVAFMMDNSIFNFERTGYTRGLDYTPGLPLLLIFPDFILFNTKFSVNQSIYVTLVSSMAVAAFLYDVIKSTFKKDDKNITAYILIALSMWCSKIWFPGNVLIEPFLIHMYFGLFLSLYCFLHGMLKNKTGLFVLGLFIFYAFVLKTPSLLFLPPLILVVFYWQENIYWEEGHSFIGAQKRVTIDLISLLGLFFVGLIVWKLHLTQVPQSYAIYSDKNIMNWHERAYLLPRYFNAIWHSHSHNITTLTLVVLAMLGYVIEILNRPKRWFFITITSFFMLYLAGLIWLYISSLGLWNAEHMVSIDRHITLVKIPYYAFGLLFLSFRILTWINFYIKPYLMRIPVISHSLFIWIIFAFVFYKTAFLANTNYTKLRLLPFHTVKGETDILDHEIIKHNLKQPKILIISQGNPTLKPLQAKYYTFSKNFIKHNAKFRGTTFGSTHATHWTEVITRENMLKLLNAQDIIWLFRTDGWLDPMLAEITKNGKCPRRWDQYFLFKNKNGMFNCVNKNPKQMNCDDLLKKEKITSGFYKIDPDGFGPEKEITVKCEIINNKGWTLVAKISKKNKNHTSIKSVNKKTFSQQGQWGKLSDKMINQLSLAGEYRFICGTGNPNQIFLRSTTWRSNENKRAYRAEYSIDGKNWFSSQQRGSASWAGFDNYNDVLKKDQYQWFFAYSTDGPGCTSASNGKAADGQLWVR